MNIMNILIINTPAKWIQFHILSSSSFHNALDKSPQKSLNAFHQTSNDQDFNEQGSDDYHCHKLEYGSEDITKSIAEGTDS